ncbi:MAG: HlyD family efflux transporter periplasmic adaptor subunit [Roseobacter sp.]
MNRQIGEGAQKPNPSSVHADQGKVQTDAMLRLLQLEADIRSVETEHELLFHMANESRNVLAFRQAFVLRRRRRWRLAVVSSVSTFDRNAPLNLAIVQFAESLRTTASEDQAVSVDLSEYSDTDTLKMHPFRYALWLPMRTRQNKLYAGLLLLREAPWPKAIVPLAERVVATYGHAWEALSGRKLNRQTIVSRRILLPVFAAALLSLGLFKAPLTVLAPSEVTGRDRVTVAAAITGVVEEVTVSPNSLVEAGTLLARYDDTELRNALEIADRETIVARAQLEKLQNASFSDQLAARELKIAEAELELALAESALARDRLARVEIRSSRAGLVVFEDARDLIGRPVSVGERLMEIVDPDDLEFTIRLPVSDSIMLEDGARVRVFQDSNPLNPVSAVLSRRSYRATFREDGSFAYTLTATGNSENIGSLRLGAQGTAQLFGDRHTLFFIVFRRPISWVRQRFGF